MNTSSRPRSAHDVQRLRESTEWLIRLSNGAPDGTLDDEELAAWIRWYETDCGNARAFEEMQTLWDRLGLLGRASVNAAAPFEREPAPRPDAPAERNGLRGVLEKFLPSLAGASGRRFAWGSLLAAGALGVCALVALVMMRTPLTLPPDGTLGTGLAENQEAVLPDGSTVALGAHSSLALEYEPAARHLKLTQGQAYFNVAKDKTRPFAVDTGELRILAVGTAFDVRKNDGRVAVTVTEGIVDIITDPPPLGSAGAAPSSRATGRSAPIRVAAGYQLIWDKGASDGRKQILQLSQVDTAGMTAWREGRLEYVNEPLSVVIADVNRYSSRQLLVDG
ncbi:MAG TPA: FecR domain-containing protein, partial [Povalibacter sp.]|nr:FecR domain-containing protein [Povalibacter sp.]